MNLRRAIFLLSILSMSIFASVAPAQSPTPNATGARPAFAQPRAPRKPIPLQWKLAAVAGVLVVSLGVLRRASRSWRKWNLFDRQYRFPIREVAPRLGGTRSGGCTATIEFRRDSIGENA